MRKLLLFFVVLGFVSCEKKEEKHAFPRLADKNAKNVISVNSIEMLESNAGLLACNFKHDVGVPYSGSHNDEMTYFAYSPYIILPEYRLIVIIDTSYSFATDGYEYKRLPHWREGDEASLNNYFEASEKLRNRYVSSYPVLIRNEGNETAVLEFTTLKFPIIQEALDNDGKWKPIEFVEPKPVVCNPGVSAHLLFPNNYMATSVIRYKGNFKTKIRVKIQNGRYNYYSNEVTGYINRSQFDHRFMREYLKENRGLRENYFEGQQEIRFLNFVNPSYWSSKDSQ
jgi:hypothetical protein